MKAKIKQLLYWFIKNEGMHALVSLGIMSGLIVYFVINKMDVSELFEFSLFFSILAAMLLEVLAVFLSKLCMNLVEDSVKLDVNYERLCKRYVSEMITYNNKDADSKNLLKLKKWKKEEPVRFPVVEDVALYKYANLTLEIEDKQDMYVLPEEIQEHFTELFQAHDSSNTYNQLNIRVDDWGMEENKFKLVTSRTTYFNSLVTNRSMDMKWENGLSTRDVYEYGPYIPELKDEKLSNHLGFNGFIESADGYIPFIKRSRSVSIGKSTYGDSVGASLKTKYALNNSEKRFTLLGLTDGILREIEDELKITREQLEDFTLEKNLISAYRDMVEGGKPQFLFWAKSKLKHKEIEKNFVEAIKKKKKKQKQNSWDKELKELEDGEKFLWIPKDQLKRMVIVPDQIIYDGKKYAMMPSASAAIVMLIEFLDNKKRNDH